MPKAPKSQRLKYVSRKFAAPEKKVDPVRIGSTSDKSSVERPENVFPQTKKEREKARHDKWIQKFNLSNPPDVIKKTKTKKKKKSQRMDVEETLMFSTASLKDSIQAIDIRQNSESQSQVKKSNSQSPPSARTKAARKNIASSYFRRELVKTVANEEHLATIVMPHVSADTFEIILKCIYGGDVDLENMDNRLIFDLMLSADELEFKELSEKLETLFIEEKSHWLLTSFFLVYKSVFNKVDRFKRLENFCIDIIVKYPNIMFDSSEFIFINESALVSLLKRNDLEIEEIKIWDKVIEWGVAQNPGLPSKLEEWTEVNFMSLKITLQRCLPYIRYFQLSTDDVARKLLPYRKILGKQLWCDIMMNLISPDDPIESLILPARKSTNTPMLQRRIKSTILSDEHAAEISSWIDRNPITYPTSDIPYEFQLILRGSRDGFDPQTFWNMSHGHAFTVIVVKVERTGEILGGYNPLTWDQTSNGYKATDDSFIFSLKSGKLQNSILSRVRDHNLAVLYRHPNFQNSYGPYFGGCSELHLFHNRGRIGSCSNQTDCYERPIRRLKRSDEYFNIVDYEVFAVSRKVTYSESWG
ncbi:4967_t:CDS:2 [Acaulospora colombiana]|uniref:4967_t:CDS:1 n=1 Tax=Acaulospora colombiana TaxID=27376 RepID=A0ACA9KM26_9GLOM|nr:4967_t:CDS:2 [Acaulospora colombiana]